MNQEFSRILRDWYHKNGRNLPWRTTRDPYKIWLSEIILQQTRVDQGLPYYLRFIEAFPRVELLAAAPEDEVLRLWQGLGYYSRARNLQSAAKQVVSEFNARFPADYNSIKSLKGVGDYTAPRGRWQCVPFPVPLCRHRYTHRLHRREESLCHPRRRALRSPTCRRT